MDRRSLTRGGGKIVAVSAINDLYTIGTRAWADARVQRIYGGSNEIMREIIGRTLDV